MGAMRVRRARRRACADRLSASALAGLRGCFTDLDVERGVRASDWFATLAVGVWSHGSRQGPTGPTGIAAPWAVDAEVAEVAALARRVFAERIERVGPMAAKLLERLALADPDRDRPPPELGAAWLALATHERRRALVEPQWGRALGLERIARVSRKWMVIVDPDGHEAKGDTYRFNELARARGVSSRTIARLVAAAGCPARHGRVLAVDALFYLPALVERLEGARRARRASAKPAVALNEAARALPGLCHTPRPLAELSRELGRDAGYLVARAVRAGLLEKIGTYRDARYVRVSHNRHARTAAENKAVCALAA